MRNDKFLERDSTATKSLDFVCLMCREEGDSCQEEVTFLTLSATGPEGKARAFFSAPPPTIVFCANRLHSAGEVEETMMHELIHAYDVGASSFMLLFYWRYLKFVVRKMDITKPNILACSEIRAARESECYQKAFLLAKLLPESNLMETVSEWKNKRCVRTHAIRSTQVTAQSLLLF